MIHIQRDVDLLPYNTFHFPCQAAFFVEITTPTELQELITTTIYQQHDHLILGGGSNILLTSTHYPGIVIKNNILGKEIIASDDQQVTIRVGGGENWDRFVRWALDQGYAGVENLVSIPGTVGAAPLQNIGAYGVEVAERILEVHYISLADGSQYTLPGEACHFGYRDSIFKQSLKGKVCITHVTFELEKYTPTGYTPHITYGAIIDRLQTQGYDAPRDNLTPHILADTIAAIRADKLPDRTQLGTAGSFFKNPIISTSQFQTLTQQHPTLKAYPVDASQVKLSAGQLIDMSGYKGVTTGSVGTYSHHALVLVHHGEGTGQDIVNLARTIQQTVKDTFGVTIEPEVQYIGNSVK